MTRVFTALTIVSASGVGWGCNALLNIDQTPKLKMDGGAQASCDGITSDAGTCLTLRRYGSYAVTGTGFGQLARVYGLGDGGRAQLAGVQIQVTQPGVLVHLGLLAAFGTVFGYLGLYTDEGGRPGREVASTSEFEVAGDAQVSNPQPTIVDVIHPTPLAPDYYWILGIWKSDFYFATSSGTPDCGVGCVPWYQLYVPYGLPDAATPELVMQLRPTPILYAEVATQP